MKTQFEIQADLRKRAARCERLAEIHKASGDKLSALRYLTEALASIEAAKMVCLLPLEMVAPFLQSLTPVRPRKQPRPRRVTPQYALRLAARLSKPRLTQESPPKMTHYTGRLASLNEPTSAPSGEDPLAKRAREIVNGNGAIGAESSASVEAEMKRRIQSGYYAQPSHNLPTRRDADPTDDSSDESHHTLSEYEARKSAVAAKAPLATEDERTAVEKRLGAENRSADYIATYLAQWDASHRTEELRTAKSAGMSAGASHATAQHEHAESTRKDGDEYIVDRLRREDAERTRGRWLGDEG